MHGEDNTHMKHKGGSAVWEGGSAEEERGQWKGRVTYPGRRVSTHEAATPVRERHDAWACAQLQISCLVADVLFAHRSNVPQQAIRQSVPACARTMCCHRRRPSEIRRRVRTWFSPSLEHLRFDDMHVWGAPDSTRTQSSVSGYRRWENALRAHTPYWHIQQDAPSSI